MNGKVTGKKINGEELSRIQRKAVEYGKKKFEIHEYKTDMQFKSLLSRLKAQYKSDIKSFSEVKLPADDDATDDGTIPTDEDAYCT